MEQAARIVSFPGMGLKFDVNRVAFQVGSLPIYWYGIIIAVGFILAILYATKRSKEFGVDPDRLIDVILGGAVGGIIGARLYYVAFKWDYYGQNLDQIFNTRSGGMAIYGGIIGALLFGFLMCRLRKVRFLPTVDLASSGFLIGQAVGRWGNFVNIEAFGSNTSLPWGMSAQPITDYLTQHEAELEALGMNIDPNMPVHPTFLYESLWCLLGFALIALYTKRRRFDGEVTLFYLAWYGAGRVVIEGLRTDSLIIPGTSLRASQILAGVLVVAAAAAWILIRTRIKQSGDPEYLRLFATTEEARQIAEGTFYQKKPKEESAETAQASAGEETLEETELPEVQEQEGEQETAQVLKEDSQPVRASEGLEASAEDDKKQQNENGEENRQ